MIYDGVDELLRRGDFSQLDEHLAHLDVAALSTTLLIGVLTATLPAKGRLPARAPLFLTVEKTIRDRGEYEDGMLTGL